VKHAIVRADASDFPEGQLDAGRFVTHRFSMDEFEQAYDVFSDAASNGALRVVLTREEGEADE
jgi:alcohol dehydrogenase